MTRASVGLVFLAALVLAVALWPDDGTRAVAQEPGPKADPALAGSTVAALLDANGGKVPATGRELWQALTKLGKFAQLPVVFSAVRLDSGVANPRVVIAPAVAGLIHDPDDGVYSVLDRISAPLRIDS